MMQECIANQVGTTADDISLIGVVSVFHSAVATFFAPSDPSGTHGM